MNETQMGGAPPSAPWVAHCFHWRCQRAELDGDVFAEGSKDDVRAAERQHRAATGHLTSARTREDYNSGNWIGRG